jgi:hypothetical protein
VTPEGRAYLLGLVIGGALVALLILLARATAGG